MNVSRRKRTVGRAMPYNREKMKDVLAKIDIHITDEDIAPYQPWEERLLGAVNGLLQTNRASEQEAITQALGQYKLFVYFLESELPEIIQDNPGAGGGLILAIAAQRYTTKLMLAMQRANEEAEQTNAPMMGPEKMA